MHSGHILRTFIDHNPRSENTACTNWSDPGMRELNLVKGLAVTIDKVNRALNVAFFEVMTATMVVERVLSSHEPASIEGGLVSSNIHRGCLLTHSSGGWSWCRVLRISTNTSKGSMELSARDLGDWLFTRRFYSNAWLLCLSYSPRTATLNIYEGADEADLVERSLPKARHHSS